MNRVPMSKKARVKFPMEGQVKICYECKDRKVYKGGLCVICYNIYKAAQAKNEIKRTPFTKKHKVVHKVEDPNAEAKLSLIRKAVKLRGEIFRHLPCVMCLVDGNKNLNTVPHHILHKGSYDRLRFVLMNLIPLCNYHHRWNDNSERNFLQVWLLDNLPRHYRYYLNERDNRTPVQQTVESLTKIVADLQDYADNPLEAEMVIYEKG